MDVAATFQPSVDDAYALDARKRSFVRPESEIAYVAWRFERTTGLTTMYTIASAVFWATAAVLMVAFDLRTAALLIAGVMGPTLGFLYVVIRRRSARWTARAWRFSVAVSGLLGVGLGAFFLGSGLHGAVLAGVVLACFWHLSGANEQPVHTASAVASYMLAECGSIAFAFRHGVISGTSLVFETWVLVSAYSMAIAVAVIADRRQRHDFRQERIIEQQKETISRERERSEELLKRELSHQVAERSRELGAVLAKADLATDATHLVPGDRFAARYRVVSVLGVGGMGCVYEVERMTDGQRLALKAISGKVSPEIAARFAREAEIGARIRHPNAVAIVDVGVSSGLPFLVMELVRGGTLEDQRERFGDSMWALPLLKQICGGIIALHDAGVVHRDLKPANVLIDGGVARISDFGISRIDSILNAVAPVDPMGPTIAPPHADAAKLTGTGVMLGTPLYMAPEAARAGSLDGSADVFALGIIAYEMLTGRNPFRMPPILLAMAQQPIPSPPSFVDERIPASLRKLVGECLSPDPKARPRARALLDAISAVTSA